MAQAAQPQPEPQREPEPEVRREPEWYRSQRDVSVIEPRTESQRRDQVRWGPIWAGVIVAMATLVILSVLGTAIGVTAADAAAEETIEVGGYIWGAAMFLIAFFLGGFAAGRTAAVAGPMSGAFNGAMVWALGLVLAITLTTLGAGAAVGILGAFGMTGEDAEGVFAGFDEAGLWWAFGALVIGLAVAAVGGMVGGPRENPEAGRE
jgi:hypothetical protein